MTVGRIPSVEGGIQPTIFDAKGDLLTATANDTPARLAVGNNGETLVADSSTSTGLRYQEPKAANPVLNSAFQVWQRGTSVSGAGGGAYTADRWFLYAGSNGTVSRQATGDTTNLPNIQYCARVGRPVSTTDTTGIPFSQSFETVNSIPFAGKTITWSFYARKGANYSAASSLLYAYLYTGTGTDQNQRVSGYTNQAQPIAQTATLTTTWQRFQFTATLATNITELSLDYSFAPVGTAGAADYFEVTGVQLEVGSIATPFKTNGATFQGELAACKYYYDKRGGQTGTGTILNNALSNSAGTNAAFNFPVTMRVAPTAVEYASLRLSDTSSGFTVSSVTLTNCTSTTANVNVATTGMTGFRSCYLDSSATGNYIAFSAEL
jgi:hypothetical protein